MTFPAAGIPGLQTLLQGLVKRPAEVETPPKGINPDPVAQGDADRTKALAGFKPGPAEAEIIDLVKKRFTMAENAKVPYLKIWATCLAFYVGEQWREWNAYQQQLVLNADMPSWRVRQTHNITTQLVQTIAAKRAKARHVTLGIPNNPQNPQDVDASRLATKVLRHLDRITERDLKRLELELTSTIYGTAFTLPYWDPNKATTIALQDPATGMVRGKEVFLGDLDFEVLDPWNVFPAPTSKWRNVEWVIVARTRHLEWVKNTFPQRGQLVNPDHLEADLFAAMERTALSPHTPHTTTSMIAPQDSVRVLEYFEKPSQRYPEGRYYVVANQVYLHGEHRLPNPKRRLPVIPYFGIYVPNRLWGRGWVEDLVPQQRSLNQMRSKIIESINLMSRPKWAVAREAGVDEDALHSGPGEVVEYNASQGAGPPVPLSPPSVAADLAQQPAEIIEYMRDIAGQHEVSTAGGTPAGVSSGVAIDLLQQADEGRLAIPTAFAAEAWRQTDQLLLEMAQVNYQAPRVIRVTGDRKGEDAALSFLGSDLAGNTDIGLEETQGVSDSVAALRQRMMDYNQAGFLDPQRYPLEMQERMFTLMGEQSIAEMVQEEMDAQAAQQQQQAEQAQQAQQQQAAQDDQDQLHQLLAAHAGGEMAAQTDQMPPPDQGNAGPTAAPGGGAGIPPTPEPNAAPVGMGAPEPVHAGVPDARAALAMQLAKAGLPAQVPGQGM